jgi:hypothetical protein
MKKVPDAGVGGQRCIGARMSLRGKSRSVHERGDVGSVASEGGRGMRKRRGEGGETC